MSDDVVDRLRVVQCCVFDPRCDRCQADDAAAKEIERLRNGIRRYLTTDATTSKDLLALIEEGDDA